MRPLRMLEAGCGGDAARCGPKRRLFGVRMDGIWLHVGTPEAIREAELSVAESAA